MNKLKFISLAAGLVLALSFTFSCSSDDGGDPPAPSSPSAGSGSSSSGGGSSSSNDGSSSSVVAELSSSGGGEQGLSSSGGGESSSSGAEVHLCGTVEYNPSTEFCLGTTVTPLCGGKEFASSEFCFDGEVIDKCGGAEYDPGTHYCHDGQAHTCGNLPHNPLTHLCHTDGELYTCDGKPLNPDEQFCYENSKIGKYCGDREDMYDPDLYECKPNINPNGIYLKSKPKDADNKEYEAVLIGTQTWMAENLNYDVPDNATDVCYSNQLARCDTYGRLYNWSTATALDASCNSNSCSGQIQAKHKGICPDGWHLPSEAEWTALANNVGSSTAGTKLKAASGWNSNGNGTDDYGFSALPGGYGNSSGSFSSVGYYGYWWSATEYNASRAYRRDMNDSSATVYRYGSNKSTLYSVRCVQD